jgi:hypothetical protein
MTHTSERRWAIAVRVLALLLVLSTAVAIAEACSLRKARAEIQRLRDARPPLTP